MRRTRLPILLAVALVAGIGPLPGSAAKPLPGTNLLFTFVTNQAGFDTLLTIANTSFDTAGTTLVDGKCTLDFFGTAAQPFDTATIAAGTTLQVLASTVAPGFQ